MSLVRSASRGACLIALTAFVAGCEAAPRYPTEDGAPLGTGGVIVNHPKYPADTTAPAPTAPVTPSGNAGSSTSSVTAPGPVSQQALPPPEPKPVDAPPPREITVEPGETIYDVAARRHAPVRAIIEANHIASPYLLNAGQKLIVPQAAVYVVSEGDTLFGVSRRFGVEVQALATLNELTLQSHLRLGERLLLPAAAKDHGPDPRANGDLSQPLPPHDDARLADDAATHGHILAEPETTKTPTRGRKPSRTAADAITAAQTSPTATALGSPLPTSADDAAAVAAGRGRFQWPVQGEIASRFGPKGTGQRNDGVDIAAPYNTPVMAAADGEVVYAGSSIAAFGNLILVKHADGWVTAYAHLAKISVKIRANVTQGQTLGLVGDTGSPGSPQLHFEMRYAASPKDKPRPIDPSQLLPK